MPKSSLPIRTGKTTRLTFSRALLFCVSFCPALACLPPVLMAQSLEDALVSTYLTNPTIRGQRAFLRATTEDVAEAFGDWRPTIAVESEVQANDVDRDDDQDAFLSSSVALVIEQNLYRGGGTTASINQAEQLVMYERARLAAIEQDVLLDAAEAYIGLANDLALLELAEQNERRLTQRLKATREQFKAGQVTGTDVAQAEARLAEAIAERDRSKGVVEASKATYRSITSQEPVLLSDPIPLPLPTADDAGAQDLASASNPRIKGAQYKLAAAEADIRATKAGLYPSLDLQAELSYEDEPSIEVKSERAASIGLALRVPLYQGGGDYARVRRAKQIVGQRKDDLEAVKRVVSEEASRAWQELAAARARIGSLQSQVRAAQTAVEGARRETQAGQRTTLDVLDLESDFFQAEVDLATARRDEIVASYQLGAATGRLTASQLDLPVKLHDTERYHGNNRNRLFGLGD